MQFIVTNVELSLLIGALATIALLALIVFVCVARQVQQMPTDTHAATTNEKKTSAEEIE